MKFEFGFGRTIWNWERHQIFILPTLGIIDRRHYFGYLYFKINFTWLLWGAYVAVSAPPKERKT